MKKIDKAILLICLILTSFLLLGRFFHYPNAVRDIVTGQFPENIRLFYPKIYLFFAPFFQFADHWTILSFKQHLSFLFSLILGWIFLKVYISDSEKVNYKKEIGYFFIFIFIFVSIVAVIILIPRPMARLEVVDPDGLVVDFHTHTNCSWDARKSFTPENKQKITDHLMKMFPGRSAQKQAACLCRIYGTRISNDTIMSITGLTTPESIRNAPIIQ